MASTLRRWGTCKPDEIARIVKLSNFALREAALATIEATRLQPGPSKDYNRAIKDMEKRGVDWIKGSLHSATSDPTT